MLWRDVTYHHQGLRGQNFIARRERSCDAREPRAAKTEQSIIPRGDPLGLWTRDHAQKIWRMGWRNGYVRSTVTSDDPAERLRFHVLLPIQTEKQA